MSEWQEVVLSVVWSSLITGAPLVLAATGEILCERSGVLNLSVEGIMLLGALVGIFGSLFGMGVATAAACAVILGLACGLVLACVILAMRANQIVTGIAFNMVALGLSEVIMRRLTAIRGGDLILDARAAWLPPLAYVAIPAVWFWLHRTGTGLVTRAAGESPLAVEAAGKRVNAVRLRALLTGCVLAALGGMIFSVGCQGFFRPNMTAGRGYIAVAIVYFANWNVWAVLWTTFLFGGAEKAQIWIRVVWPRAEQAAPLLQTFPYILTVLVLALFVGRSRVPRALMKPYVPEGRESDE